VVASSYADRGLFAPIAKDVLVIENGVQLCKFGELETRANSNSFLYLGRFSENKNLLNLVRWFAAAHARDRELRLCIAGREDNQHSEAVRREVSRLDCADVIEVLADPSNAQIRAAIERSRFVISASTYEGFGLSIPELMSYGLVPVLSEIPSFCHFIQQSGIGELFGFGEDQFVAAVQRAVADHSPAQMRRAEEFARGYSWDTVALRFEAVYDA
jgi:alpha-1,3-mannosyltransferase